ncbi:MAG: DNA sulfur modification protein DndD [Trichormus sp.]
MIFLELVLQNFGPYAGRQVINLDTRSAENYHPIILLGGMNGGGKTTLMDAIRLALYGQRAQCSTRGNLNYSDFLTQCVNNKANPTDKTRIELLFEHIEDDKPVKYRIVRTWEKNPKDGKDTLGILGDDDTWPVDSLVNIWDDYIENLLPLGISNLFLFDGEQVKELAEQETPPPIVVEAIRGLLGLELADRLAVDLEILVNRKRKEIAETKDLANLEAIENRLKQYQEDYQVIELELETLKFLTEELETKQREALDKFISEGGKIAGQRNQLEQQQKDKVSRAEEIRESMCALAADVLPLAFIPKLVNQVQAQGTKEFRHQQIQLAKDVLIERDQRLVNWLNGLNINLEQIDKIESFLKQDTENLYTFNSSEPPWLLADEESLSQLDNVQYHLPNAQKSAQQHLAKLKDIEEEIINLERQVQTAAEPEAYKQLRDGVEDAQNQLAQSKAKYETTRQNLAELAEIIEQTKQELKEYTDKNIDRKNREHIIDSVAKVQETLKLFREKLTLKKLNKLEEEVKNCFLYLLHKSDLVRTITIDTKTFSLSIYDFNGKPVPKHRLSAGEKQLLAIAFLWGLAKVSGLRLPVAIDTPLGRLDSSHRHNLVEKYFPAASHQVILLSTDTEIGKKEVQALRNNEAIAREYLLKYDSSNRETTVIENQYFWE